MLYRSGLRISTICLILTAFFPASSHAGTWVAFGPVTYTRGAGPPVTVTDTFTVLNPATQYTLKAFNGGLQDDTTELVSGCVVLVNGVQVIGPGNFNKNISELDVPVALLSSNTISVQVKGKPGGVLAIEVIGVDNDPPTISATLSPQPNAAGWNNSPVTVTFTCSDKTSGVASCPAPVTVSTEGANQVVSGTATDLAGNTATTSVTVNLDMTPPTITGTINPPPDADGYNSGPVTVNFTCTDALSGVASCSAPVSVTGEGTTQVPGTATDVAGNIASINITVNISLSYFKIRSWQTNPAGDPSQTGKCLDYGATVFLNDCASANAIRVVEIGERDQKDAQGNVTFPLQHEVMLFAGNQVIGVHNPQTLTLSATSSPAQPVTEYQLELQAPFSTPRGALFTAAQQIWRLDGDSIILEGSHLELQTNTLLPTFVEVPGPCINSETTAPSCPPPPPQLVIQVQNARGANGSPLVAAVRNLADNEFWDFVPLAGSRPYPTTGFASVSTNYDLWNSICGSTQVQAGIDPPQVSLGGTGGAGDLLTHFSSCAPFKAGWGSVIVVSSPNTSANNCSKVPGPTDGQTQDIGACIDLSYYPPVALPPGVTIRGDRRSTNFGPQLYYSFSKGCQAYSSLPKCDGFREFIGLCQACVFHVAGDYARVTGLRLHGESRSTDPLPFKTNGIWIEYAGRETGPDGQPPQIPLFPLNTVTELIATIDHNDMSDWMDAAVTANSPFSDSAQTGGQCSYIGYVNSGSMPIDSYPCNEHTIPQTVPYSTSLGLMSVTIADDPLTLGNTRVARNFLHHNMRDDGGYGVAMGNEGGRVLIEGNTFLWNRHDITAAGEPHSEYRASHNLVLSSAYDNYGGFFAPFIGRLQDFDMHGTSDVANSIYVGGAGGYYVEIDGNTFLGTNGHDYVLRGYPDIHTYYHHNVSRRNENDAIHFIHCIDFVGCINDYHASDFPIDISTDNQFADSSSPYTDPTIRFGPASLGVGDFDGDGDDDLFVATGVAWYYSPAGAREWRFLNAAPDTVDQLLFGDFDRDGRTDVVAMRNGQLVISWGGISAFEVLNGNPCTTTIPVTCPTSVADLAVGDFDGDGKPDIFWADGTNWYVSLGGSGPFNKVNGSSFHVRDLRFGHFAICGAGAETDVFSVQSSGWNVSCGASLGWQPLGVALTNTVNGLVVADFNGDGVADVLAPSSDGWQISYGGSQPWTDVPQQFGVFSSVALAGVGHFTGQRQADVLVWNGISLLLSPPAVTGTELLLSAAGVSPATQYSTQDMR